MRQVGRVELVAAMEMKSELIVDRQSNEMQLSQLNADRSRTCIETLAVENLRLSYTSCLLLTQTEDMVSPIVVTGER